jgi:hypothetical protein
MCEQLRSLLASEIVLAAIPVEFDKDQNAPGDWVEYGDFRMTLEEFVTYQQKALTKFARYWAQSGRPQLQEPEHWQNHLCDYCDHQPQYNVASWPLDPGCDFQDFS